MKRNLDPTLVSQFYKEHKKASRLERGKIITDYAALTGLSKPTLHKIIKQMDIGENPFTVAQGAKTRGESRKPKHIQEIEKKDAMVIAAYKQANFGASTEIAIEVCYKQQLISCLYERSTMDRLLDKHGISARHFEYSHKSVHVTAPYPNRVWYVDASPMEQYYFEFQEKSKETNIIYLNEKSKDKHLSDLIANKKFRKIWVYYAVDLFSRAYYLLPFCGDPSDADAGMLGENHRDRLAFFQKLFLPKTPVKISGVDHIIPLEGIPEAIYSDKGFSTKSIKAIMARFNCDVSSHMTGNPAAKGIVERRIGAFKQQYERILPRALVHSFDDLVNFLHQWMVYDNTKKGYYQTYLQGTKIKPIKTIVLQDWYNVTTEKTNRLVDAYGRVSINGKFFTIENSDILQKTQVSIFSNISGAMIAYDRNGMPHRIVEGDSLTTEFGNFKRKPDTDKDRNRKEVEELGKKINKEIILESILPSSINVTHFPVKHSQGVTTNSPIAPENFLTVESAILFILEVTKLTAEEIDPIKWHDYIDMMKQMHSKFGKIQSVFIYECIKDLNKNRIFEFNREATND